MITLRVYVAVLLLLAVGAFMMIENDHLVKKVVGLNVFQTGVFLFFVATAYVEGGSPPVVTAGEGPHVSPLPHVIVLTAIVVGLSLTAVGLGLAVRIYADHGTLDAGVLREVRSDE